MALWLASAKATTTPMDTVYQGEGHSSHPSEHQPLFWALNLKNKIQTPGKKNHRRSNNYREDTKSYTAGLEGNLLLQCLAFFSSVI